MRLRTSLFLSIVAVLFLQSLLVVPMAIQSVTQLLSAQHEARVESTFHSLTAAWKQMEAQVLHAVEELAQSDSLAQALKDLEDDSTSSLEVSVWMKERRLSVLSILEANGKTVASGHLPARRGDVDVMLWKTTHVAVPFSYVQVEVPGKTGLQKVPALVTARRLRGTHEPKWLVAGMLLDQDLAEFLSKLSLAQVEIVTPEGLSAVAGQAQAPWLEKNLAFLPLGEVKFKFSRAEQQEATQRVVWAFGALFSFGVLLALVVAWWLARRMTQPLEGLSLATRDIAQGHWGTQVHMKASGEVKDLVQLFNDMSQTLQATTNKWLASQRIADWQEVARRLAHEMKNPLTPIQMSLETLMAANSSQHPQFPKLFEESVSIVLEEVGRLKRIVSEFSQFARLPNPQKTLLNLSEWAETVLKLYRSPRQNLRMTTSLAENVWVLADRDQLSQVLINLLKNADEAMPQGGRVHLQVRTHQREAVLEVQDEGPGVKPADRLRILEPYFTRKQGGTGLGLAIAARICAEHGGRLEVGGEEGRGAVFSIFLPASEPNSP